MRKLLRWFKRAIRRLQPDIVRVKCAKCGYMTDAFDIYHFCINDIQKQRQER